VLSVTVIDEWPIRPYGSGPRAADRPGGDAAAMPDRPYGIRTVNAKLDGDVADVPGRR
jgi:hypothetical protein